jgi:hypothetical protein
MSSLLVSNAKESKFYFQQRHGSLDIRRISKIDIESLISETNIDVLQSCIENITFSLLKSDDLKFMTDPLIIKTFQLCQLLIEYLLFVQEELIGELSKKTEKYASLKREMHHKRKELATVQETCDHYSKIIDSKRKRIKTLESLLKEANSKKSRRLVIRHYSQSE